MTTPSYVMSLPLPVVSSENSKPFISLVNLHETRSKPQMTSVLETHLAPTNSPLPFGILFLARSSAPFDCSIILQRTNAGIAGYPPRVPKIIRNHIGSRGIPEFRNCNEFLGLGSAALSLSLSLVLASGALPPPPPPLANHATSVRYRLIARSRDPTLYVHTQIAYALVIDMFRGGTWRSTLVSPPDHANTCLARVKPGTPRYFVLDEPRRPSGGAGRERGCDARG